MSPIVGLKNFLHLIGRREARYVAFKSIRRGISQQGLDVRTGDEGTQTTEFMDIFKILSVVNSFKRKANNVKLGESAESQGPVPDFTG